MLGKNFILKISLFAVQSKFLVCMLFYPNFSETQKNLESPLCINKFEVIAIHIQCIFMLGFQAWPESLIFQKMNIRGKVNQPSRGKVSHREYVQ